MKKGREEISSRRRKAIAWYVQFGEVDQGKWQMKVETESHEKSWMSQEQAGTLFLGSGESLSVPVSIQGKDYKSLHEGSLAGLLSRGWIW